MSSFLDKLLSPSVARDIGAMGIRGTEEFGETLMDATEKWYNSNKDIAGNYGGMNDWDDLSSNAKEKLSEFLAGNIGIEDMTDIAPEINSSFYSIPNQAGAITMLSTLLGSAGSLSDFKRENPSQVTSPESFGGIGFNPLSRESILENLPDVGKKYTEGSYEGSSDFLLESVKPLTMDQIRKTTTGFYNPYIEKEKKPLVDRLIDKRKTATALGGDFAGYGQREQYQDIAEGSFMSGVENIYSDVDAERASALDDLYGTIASWQDVGEIA